MSRTGKSVVLLAVLIYCVVRLYLLLPKLRGDLGSHFAVSAVTVLAIPAVGAVVLWLRQRRNGS